MTNPQKEWGGQSPPHVSGPVWAHGVPQAHTPKPNTPQTIPCGHSPIQTCSSPDNDMHGIVVDVLAVVVVVVVVLVVVAWVVVTVVDVVVVVGSPPHTGQQLGAERTVPLTRWHAAAEFRCSHRPRTSQMTKPGLPQVDLAAQ